MNKLILLAIAATIAGGSLAAVNADVHKFEIICVDGHNLQVPERDVLEVIGEGWEIGWCNTIPEPKVDTIRQVTFDDWIVCGAYLEKTGFYEIDEIVEICYTLVKTGQYADPDFQGRGIIIMFASVGETVKIPIGVSND